MARLRNFVSKIFLRGFRAVLFRMVPKHEQRAIGYGSCFRAVLFRMVPKLLTSSGFRIYCFRAVLFRMVPKHYMEWKRPR